MSVATAIKRWTLEELHSLPDDGNKYELVHGELFVTPPPNPEHETIASRLTDILAPYVRDHGLGYVYHPRAVLRFRGSEVEPDLMVRQPPPKPKVRWEDMPLPVLVVEIISDSTRRRDRGPKRDFYMVDAGVADYWIVDADTRTITAVRQGEPDRVADDHLIWEPAGTSDPLKVVVADVFSSST
jgi:Uma2 family endonuclease